VHVLRERLDLLERRIRQHAVAEIEDVAGATARAAQDIVRRGKQPVLRAEKERRMFEELRGGRTTVELLGLDPSQLD